MRLISGQNIHFDKLRDDDLIRADRVLRDVLVNFRRFELDALVRDGVFPAPAREHMHYWRVGDIRMWHRALDITRRLLDGL